MCQLYIVLLKGQPNVQCCSKGLSDKSHSHLKITTEQNKKYYFRTCLGTKYELEVVHGIENVDCNDATYQYDKKITC